MCRCVCPFQPLSFSLSVCVCKCSYLWISSVIRTFAIQCYSIATGIQRRSHSSVSNANTFIYSWKDSVYHNWNGRFEGKSAYFLCIIPRKRSQLNSYIWLSYGMDTLEQPHIHTLKLPLVPIHNCQSLVLVHSACTVECNLFLVETPGEREKAQWSECINLNGIIGKWAKIIAIFIKSSIAHITFICVHTMLLFFHFLFRDEGNECKQMDRVIFSVCNFPYCLLCNKIYCKLFTMARNISMIIITTLKWAICACVCVQSERESVCDVRICNITSVIAITFMSMQICS